MDVLAYSPSTSYNAAGGLHVHSALAQAAMADPTVQKAAPADRDTVAAAYITQQLGDGLRTQGAQLASSLRTEMTADTSLSPALREWTGSSLFSDTTVESDVTPLGAGTSTGHVGEVKNTTPLTMSTGLVEAAVLGGLSVFGFALLAAACLAVRRRNIARAREDLVEDSRFPAAMREDVHLVIPTDKPAQSGSNAAVQGKDGDCHVVLEQLATPTVELFTQAVPFGTPQAGPAAQTKAPAPAAGSTLPPAAGPGGQPAGKGVSPMMLISGRRHSFLPEHQGGTVGGGVQAAQAAERRAAARKNLQLSSVDGALHSSDVGRTSPAGFASRNPLHAARDASGGASAWS